LVVGLPIHDVLEIHFRSLQSVDSSLKIYNQLLNSARIPLFF
jgi:hypothetical protein